MMMNNEKTNKNMERKETKTLLIKMAYCFVGDTSIEVPAKLLVGKNAKKQLEIAFQYAQDHISEIPVAINATYIPDSDQFELDDISF